MRKYSILIAALLFMFSTLNATVWYVHPDSSLNSIQAGMDSCADNDTVLVGPGIYKENIIWPNRQGIDLMSEYGPDTTIIDGDSAGSVIEMTTGGDTSAVISGFTIQNGYEGGGGGILCVGSPTITGNIITHNIASDTIMWLGIGGGIWCRTNSSPVIANNIIVNNSASLGGGICCDYESAPTIMGNTIAQNTANEEGGGILCWEDSASTITDNTITENTAIIGGGICCQASSPMITGNTIIGNTADVGGGILSFDYSSATISDNIISGNTAWGYGGGIMCSFSTLVIDSCTVSYNSGHGVYNTLGGILTINYCNITDNTGYGVYNRDSTYVIDARYNWWGHTSGPYHPDSNPGGLGDTVSDYVDFDPWLEIIGVEEKDDITVDTKDSGATIFSGPLVLPEGKKCRVFDIIGRVVAPDKMRPGIYFIEVDGQITQKIVKVR